MTKLHDYMKDNGINDRELAERIGVSRSAVTMWRLGNRMPKPEIMYVLEKETKNKVTASDMALGLKRMDRVKRLGEYAYVKGRNPQLISYAIIPPAKEMKSQSLTKMWLDEVAAIPREALEFIKSKIKRGRSNDQQK